MKMELMGMNEFPKKFHFRVLSTLLDAKIGNKLTS
jgi:hypothetical protein